MVPPGAHIINRDSKVERNDGFSAGTGVRIPGEAPAVCSRGIEGL